MAASNNRKPPRPTGYGGSARAGARSASGRGPAATSGRAAGARSTSSRPGSKPARKNAERPRTVRRSTVQPMRATAAAATRARSASRGVSGRTLTLAVLMICCVLLLIIPVSGYLKQRGEIEQLQEQIAAKEASISLLDDRNEMLDDPAYVKAQARERLNYVNPGEKVYVVTNKNPGSDLAKEQAAKQEAEESATTTAVQDLAGSLAEVDAG